MAMPPVCFCQGGGPAVAMRCLKNGVALIHNSELAHPTKALYRGDAWMCPSCKNVIVLCSSGVGIKPVHVESVNEAAAVVGSSVDEVSELKLTYKSPPWIGDLHD